MSEPLRYTKTEKGTDEIGQRRNNLRGKMRMMLILVDPAKTADQLRWQAAQIGLPTDFLDTLVRDGYIAPVRGRHPVPEPALATVAAGSAHAEEGTRFVKAKSFMQQTLAAGLGGRAAEFAPRIDACATRAELKQLLPEYDRAIAAVSGPMEADMLVERLRKLLV
jgi:hypothetical protein